MHPSIPALRQAGKESVRRCLALPFETLKGAAVAVGLIMRSCPPYLLGEEVELAGN